MKQESNQHVSSRPEFAGAGRPHIPLRSVSGGKGAIYPAEGRVLRDRWTGISVRQVVTHPSIHHHPFVYQPAYDDAMQWLVFVSHRTGHPQLFAEERSTGRLIQLTDRGDLNEWSIHPARDGRYVYFTAGRGAWRVSLHDFAEECYVHFGDVPMIPAGMVAEAMGTTTVSHDDRWWAVPVSQGKSATLNVIDTHTGDCQPILEAKVIGHPEFHPRDASLLRYSGPYHSRMWFVRRDGSDHRLIYRRNEQKKEWIVHEVWNPLRPELLVVNWPHGTLGVDIETGSVRHISPFPSWHISMSRDGRHMVCDTTFPDQGVHVLDPRNGHAEPRLLCESAATNQGDHWRSEHCPYDDGPVKVYAPQHTHPHPSFAPDGKRIVFTSDRSGHAQIYEAVVDELLPC
ncbi:MAG: oligogalacturonate lyase family protein [Singulisphaera sp.]